MTDQVARDILPPRSTPGQHRLGAAVRRLLSLLLVVSGIVLLVLARPSAGRTEQPSASVQTALWSARRAPQSVVEAVGAQRLSSDLASALQSTEADCAIVVVPGLGAVTSVQPDRALTGASSQKLLTANAALGVLGPDFRYVTRVTTDGEPEGSKLDKAWLLGSGDPLLQTPEYRAFLEDRPVTKGTPGTPLVSLADGIAGRGTKTIDTLYVDDTRYDAVRFLPTWRPNYKTEGQVGSLGALIVNGGFDEFRPERVPADDPALSAGNALADLLRERGVTVGSVARGAAPKNGTELAKVSSPPFREVAAEMLRVSDNTAAELIVRELAVQRGRPGTTRDGVAVVTEQLGANGVPMRDVNLLDGSGLSRDSKVTCEALMSVLAQGRAPGPVRLDDLLAVAGSSGTLAPRFQGSPLEEKLRAKTGSLNGVTALGGYVDRYRTLPFAFIANGEFGEPTGIALQNRIATVIGNYPAGPEAAALVPAPAPPCTQPDCR